ncbi:Mu transposase C-terminal domain-containing protein [Alicyclobacillus tolerans]|uniref:Mu transposase, C-terminal n=1 Tax=Alicyclobacillus tolerans TaxID=90970 RepID=A0A1M6TSS9_9BACL|nr:Mu transposase C-terminal domain-containing protein [Alicyclobacillus montanus]SHK59960.1 Mu transposase, C-terminal [Alicyclobacillus montanus]
MQLTVNMLIQFVSKDGTPDLIERALWIDEHHKQVVTIEIQGRTSLPKFRDAGGILTLLSLGQACVLSDDPMKRVISEDALTENERVMRDKAWEIVQVIAGAENLPNLFYPRHRAEAIKKASEVFGVSDKTILKYLRRFWQRGQHKNALLPDYKSGALNRRSNSIGKKRGRPRKFADIVGHGVNVDEETKRVFRVALNRFYYGQGLSLVRSYELMRREYYSVEGRGDEGTEKKELKSSAKTPTLGQFKYYFYKERDWKREVSARQGKKNYLQSHRPLVGDGTSQAFGPGSIFQIDATIADVYLVSRYNRNWVIGRPVVYGIVDTFSRMVCGLYVGLEGPSWIGAMMALANTVQNKVEFCKEYGIEIAEEDFPVHHLPEALLADQGEISSRLAEPMIKNLNIKVMTTPSYRPELKSIVERFFKILNGYVKPILPGGIQPDFRERGSHDYRLDATLDLYQFTQIMIRAVLHHNSTWMNSYQRDPLMIEDGVEPIPLKLWNWGIKNRAGKLRSIPEDLMRLHLMPTSTANITARGIRFKGMFFSSEKALRERWFEKARNDGRSVKVTVSYDPRNLNYIYIPRDDGKGFDKCYLLDHQARYRDKTMEEIEHLFEQEKFDQKANQDKVLQRKVDLLSEIDDIIRDAKRMTKLEKATGESKRKRVKDIRINRHLEKALNRQNDAFELEKRQPVETNEGQVIQLNPTTDDELNPELSLLRKKQRERFGDDE